MIPTFDIHWLVDRLHVSAPDEEVTSLINSRTTHWPPDLQSRARLVALDRHHANQHLFSSCRF